MFLLAKRSRTVKHVASFQEWHVNHVRAVLELGQSFWIIGYHTLGFIGGHLQPVTSFDSYEPSDLSVKGLAGAQRMTNRQEEWGWTKAGGRGNRTQKRSQRSHPGNAQRG